MSHGIKKKKKESEGERGGRDDSRVGNERKGGEDQSGESVRRTEGAAERNLTGEEE